MFIKCSKKFDRSTNQEYYSYQLVESYRTDRGPRQRFLLNLGTGPQNLQKDQFKELANRIEEIFTKQEPLFKHTEEIEELAQMYAKQLLCKQLQEYTQDMDNEDEEYITIDLKSLSNQDCRSIGAESIVYNMICKYGIPEKLNGLGFSKNKIDAIIANIVARAVFPDSELSTYDWLNNHSALSELARIDLSKLTLYQLYQSANDLVKHKKAIEKHLSESSKVLFNLEEKIILYDITNTYFEGLCVQNKKVKYRRSKEKRTGCPFVSMGLVVDIEGFPKYSEIFEGNVVETKTFQEMIGKLDKKAELFKPMVVIDAEIAYEGNLKWLKSKNVSYIVVSRKKMQSMPKDGIPVIVKDNEEEMVTVLKKEEGEEMLFYCHLESRESEVRMKSKREQQFEKELISLKESLDKSTRTSKKYYKVLEKVERLKEKYKKVASYYIITVEKCEQTDLATNITWTEDRKKNLKEMHKSLLFANILFGIIGAGNLGNICNVNRIGRYISFYEIGTRNTSCLSSLWA